MYLLFDIGGTKTRLAISRDGKSFEQPTIIQTPQDFKQAVALIVKTAKELVKNKKISKIVGGVPGTIDQQKNRLNVLPNLPKWNKKPLANELQKALEAPVFIENDAALAGLGEAMFGAGRGKKIVAYLTISTGTGGAKIVAGKVDPNFCGFEPGHQLINFTDHYYLNTQIHGDWESYISGTALEKRYKIFNEQNQSKKFWRQYYQYLAYGLHNVAVFWSPEVIVLGGGVMQNPNIDLKQLQLEFNKTILSIFPKAPLIKKATLGDLNGLYGALSLLK